MIVLFIVAKIWKQILYPLVMEELDKLCISILQNILQLLKKDDIVLMLSDGAVSEGTDWISAELEAWGDGSAQALAQRISECAKRRRTDHHEDDITVMAAILQKA